MKSFIAFNISTAQKCNTKFVTFLLLYRSYVSLENTTRLPRQEVKCHKWVYDKDVFKTTFASQVRPVYAF